jgi:hypothetical protein
MSVTLNELIRAILLAEGPDIASERDYTDRNHYEAACSEYVDGQLNAMSNVELLERISDAVAFGVRTRWLYSEPAHQAKR